MSDNTRLNIVNEDGEIIGEDTRANIHIHGLLHREIHVWLYTPKGDLILQHRGKDKDTYPDLLDASVGGHVELGMSFEDTALQELEEETGIKANIQDLTLLITIHRNSHDVLTGMTNNALRAVYAYKFIGNLIDLKVEEGKALGFETWPLKKIFSLTEEEKKRFIPGMYSETHLDILRKIQTLL